MTRHSTPDELARLDAGALRPRKAARIEAHVAVCVQCAQLRHQVDEVPAILASAPYPQLPQAYAVKIEAAIKVEANQRLAAAPATESGRGALPARRRQVGQVGWHLPGLSVRATRLAAAAGALVLIGTGSYALSTGLTSVTARPSAPSAAGTDHVQQLSLGPDVQYGPPGATHTIREVRSKADFAGARLRAEATAAVHAAQARGASASRLSANAPRAAAPVTGGASGLPTTARLEGCLDRVVPGQTVLMLDLAKYQGKPADIIVAAPSPASAAQVWVVGVACSATSSDVLTHESVGRV